MSPLLWSLFYCGTCHLPQLGPSQPCVRYCFHPWFSWFWVLLPPSFISVDRHFYRVGSLFAFFFPGWPIPPSRWAVLPGKPVTRQLRERPGWCSGLWGKRGLASPAASMDSAGPGPAPGQHRWLDLSTLLLVQPGHVMVSAYSSCLFQARGAGFSPLHCQAGMAGILSLLLTFLHPSLLDTLPPFYVCLFGVVSFPQRCNIAPLCVFSVLFSGSLRRVKVILQVQVCSFKRFVETSAFLKEE